MSKIITDEQELNTAVDDLVTDDYALEILIYGSVAFGFLAETSKRTSITSLCSI